MAATVLDWLGVEIPAQVDGWPLTPFLQDGAAPEHWREAAHWEWDFRYPQYRVAEYLGIPASTAHSPSCGSADAKYVQFAADAEVLPPLLFDFRHDPGQMVNLSGCD